MNTLGGHWPLAPLAMGDSGTSRDQFYRGSVLGLVVRALAQKARGLGSSPGPG